jgi:hypothetical protein
VLTLNVLVSQHKSSCQVDDVDCHDDEVEKERDSNTSAGDSGSSLPRRGYVSASALQELFKKIQFHKLTVAS